MEAAIQKLQSNPEFSLRAVAKKYGIPWTSLQFKLKTQDTRNLLVHHHFFRMKKNKR
jgi:hypothetical protein